MAVLLSLKVYPFALNGPLFVIVAFAITFHLYFYLFPETIRKMKNQCQSCL